MSETTFWAIRKREIASRKAQQAPEPEKPKKGRKRATQAVAEKPVEPVRVEESPELQEPGEGASPFEATEEVTESE